MSAGPFHASLLALVALGGAAGALCRHGLVVAAARWNAGLGAPAALPLGVPAANLLGGFAIGLLAVALTRFELTERYGPLLITGFLGGFTTFSAFSWDVVALWEKGRADLAFLYAGVSVVGAIGAAALGALIGRLAFPAT